MGEPTATKSVSAFRPFQGDDKCAKTMRTLLALLPLLLLVTACRAEIIVEAEDVDIRGHCDAAEGSEESSIRCGGSEMPAELEEWIFRRGDEDTADKYGRSNPGDGKCYGDEDVVSINGVSGAKLSSLQVC